MSADACGIWECRCEMAMLIVLPNVKTDAVTLAAAPTHLVKGRGR